MLARKNRGPLAGFLIFAGTLFPVLGFLNVYPFRYSYVADHFQYLASPGHHRSGGFRADGSGGADFAQREACRHRPAALLLATLGAATWRQSGIYRDDETLFRETLARNPASALLHNNLGVALMRLPGRVPEAMAEFEAAVRLKPDSPDFHDNLGLALAAMPGRLPDAIAEYRTALRLDPDFQAAHLNLGLALMSLPGRMQDAVAEYQKAIAEYRKTAEPNPISGRRTSTWGSPTHKCPAARPTPLRNTGRPCGSTPIPRWRTSTWETLSRRWAGCAEAIAEYRAALRHRPRCRRRPLRAGVCLGADSRPRAGGHRRVPGAVAHQPRRRTGAGTDGVVLAFQDGRGR